MEIPTNLILIYSVLTGDEGLMSRESLSQLARDGIAVSQLITDPDSASFRAAEDLFRANIIPTEPEHQIDPIHVNRNQRKYIRNAQFPVDTFPGRTASERKKQQNRLAHDLTKRCHAEHVATYTMFAGNTNRVNRRLSYMPDCLSRCYQGDHTMCRRLSAVCVGKKSNNWIHRSGYLANSFTLMLGDPGLKVFRDCVSYRLGVKILKMTKSLATTQKCEATNRAISKAVPKNITFSRNYGARCHSAVKAVNRGIGQAIYDQCQYIGAAIPAGTRVTRALLALQKSQHSKKQSNASANTKARRSIKRKRLYANYDSKRASASYSPGMLLKKMKIPTKLPDHSYAKNKYK